MSNIIMYYEKKYLTATILIFSYPPKCKDFSPSPSKFYQAIMLINQFTTVFNLFE